MGKIVMVWEEDLPYTPEQIWQVVTDLTNWQWRTDLAGCEIVDEHNFVEIPKRGNPISFHTIRFDPFRCWQFQMDSPFLTGTWQGTFEPTENASCRVRFVEDVQIQHRLIPNWIAKRFLAAYQAQYFRDLQAELQSRYK